MTECQWLHENGAANRQNVRMSASLVALPEAFNRQHFFEFHFEIKAFRVFSRKGLDDQCQVVGYLHRLITRHGATMRGKSEKITRAGQCAGLRTDTGVAVLDANRDWGVFVATGCVGIFDGRNVRVTEFEGCEDRDPTT